jgi:transcriptional regulator with XRE-family HTH domain
MSNKLKLKPKLKRGRPANRDSLADGWCGHSLRIRMAAARINTVGLAAKISVSRSTLSAYVNDRYAPSPRTVEEIADVLDCTAADFATAPKI